VDPREDLGRAWQPRGLLDVRQQRANHGVRPRQGREQAIPASLRRESRGVRTARVPEVRVAAEGGDLGGARAAQPPGPVLRVGEERVRAAEGLGVLRLEPGELAAQVQRAGQGRREGLREVLRRDREAGERRRVVEHGEGECLTIQQGRARAVRDRDDGVRRGVLVDQGAQRLEEARLGALDLEVGVRAGERGCAAPRVHRQDRAVRSLHDGQPGVGPPDVEDRDAPHRCHSADLGDHQRHAGLGDHAPRSRADPCVGDQDVHLL